MIPVTRPPFVVMACALALCVASAAARAGAPLEEPAAAEPSETSSSVAEPATAVEQIKGTSTAFTDLGDSASLAGAAGAAVGVVVGGVAGLGATAGAWALIISATGESGGDLVDAAAFLAMIATPVMLVGPPVLGAGLGANGALGLVSDGESATMGGLLAAAATPLGAAAGGVAGGAIGGALGVAQAGFKDGTVERLLVLSYAATAGVVGAAIGGVAGAAAGGALGSVDAGASE